jgi:CRISPR-associated protein Cmr5
MQTRDQKFAAIVYNQVTQVKTKNAAKEQYKPYGAMAHKLPVLIRTAGLAQALEFVRSRGKPVQQQLLEDLAVTVEQNDTATLLERVRRAELSEYMRLTQQTLAALLWYKRFAQSILDVDASEAALDEGEENNG